ncbi:MAG: hypothetical protein A2X94_04135 [Bdellovibrionales bacterium GWB1_55_8]|nr:MAG: hypothetical protein A2X94_04135 [Bdellovibrionales bacterium GWB1_55_8]
MKFWNALLESLHSAAIDELTEKFPEPKPELGLPKRASGFDAPLGCTSNLIVRTSGVEAGHALSGWVMLACDADFARAITLESLWGELQNRAQREFLRRGIVPKFSGPSVAPVRIADTNGLALPSRVIWMPFRLAPGQLQLGVGV